LCIFYLEVKMKKIQVFKTEIKDGLESSVAFCNSVAYCSSVNIHKNETLSLERVIAENKDQKDLYYLESILVSTGWNKNDDVFLPANTWSARNTPEDKQFNLMHDENDIIGHITGSYVLDHRGERVDLETDTPPDHFDILTQAVIYNSWTNPENRERMQKIIAEIENGDNWYVSMECIFSGFDYALLDQSGNGKVLARNEESSFLTKHLKAYGGPGEFEGYKVGRALREITFSGKGLVSKPANPRSIILSSKSTATFKDNISNFSIGENNMSVEITTLEKQITELKSELALAKDENKVVKAQIEQAKDKELQSTIQAFENDLSQKTSTIAEMEQTINSTKARIAELEDALAKSAEQLAFAMKEMDDMKKKEKSMKRKAALVEAGFEQDEVDEAVAKFDAVSDESFEFMVAAMKKKAKWQEDKEEMKKEETKSEENVTQAFEHVEAKDAPIVPPENNSVEAARASIVSWIENKVLSKNLK